MFTLIWQQGNMVSSFCDSSIYTFYFLGQQHKSASHCLCTKCVNFSKAIAAVQWIAFNTSYTKAIAAKKKVSVRIYVHKRLLKLSGFGGQKLCCIPWNVDPGIAEFHHHKILLPINQKKALCQLLCVHRRNRHSKMTLSYAAVKKKPDIFVVSCQ